MWSLTGLSALIVLATTIVPAEAVGASTPSANPYFTDQVTVATNPATYGQAPVFMPDGLVVYGKDFGHGAGTQIYTSDQNGLDLRCLTCELPAPNNVPAIRPQGDWILFHSWIGHKLTLGSPGYGGLGSALWVMRPNGSDVHQLTELQTGFGADEGFDDYHAYWSPDGNEVVWTHLDWNFVNGHGSGKWEVDVANFTVSPAGVPSLTDVRVVRPPNGSWYETQWWAPNGSGFLYTQTSGTAMDTELFFCLLTPNGCIVRQLTDSASWNEQALFTPDMKDVIFMSSRDHPDFLNTFVQLTKDANIPTNYDYLLALEIFELAYEQPVAQESTDLYELNLATGAIRRLITDGDDGWVTPETSWDPTTGQLVWTEIRFPPGIRVPVPLNPVQQLQSEAQLIEHPPLNDISLNTSNLLQLTLPLQYRTRVMTFGPG
jgi:Tol biopolymer transport system component